MLIIAKTRFLRVLSFYIVFICGISVCVSGIEYNMVRCIKRKKRIKRTVIALLAVAIIVAAGVYARSNIVPLVTDKAYYSIRGESVRALNNAYQKTVDEMTSLGYSDFVNIKYNSAGEINLISVDMLRVNNVMSYISTVVLDEMQAIAVDGVDVPLGAFSGILLLGDRGKDVKVEVETVGIAECNFRSDFQTVGINQVRHSLYIDIVATANVVLPLYAKDVFCESSLLLCENVIVGDVPEFYLQNQGVFDISTAKQLP